jgi:hypothetical protein
VTADDPTDLAEPVETFHVDLDTDQVPGTPLMALIVTTKGAGPLFLPALTGVAPEYQPHVAEQIAVLLHKAADLIQADLLSGGDDT